MDTRSLSTDCLLRSTIVLLKYKQRFRQTCCDISVPPSTEAAVLQAGLLVLVSHCNSRMADPPENACNATKAGALHAKRAIRTAVGHHLECITNRWLHSCLPFFLSGAEKACVDCGLWHGGECSGFPSDYSERLFRTVLDRQDESNLIALDMKTITARLASTHKGGLYHFSFRRSKEQKCCTAFIVHNPLAPHLVAVIPRSYLEVRPLETAAGDRAYYGRDIPMTGAVQEYFPLEWAPFVMAIRSLPGALRSLHDFASGLSRFW